MPADDADDDTRDPRPAPASHDALLPLLVDTLQRRILLLEQRDDDQRKRIATLVRRLGEFEKRIAALEGRQAPVDAVAKR